MSLAPSAIESLESRCLLIAGDLVGTFGNGGVLYHDGIDSDLLAVQSDGGVLAVSGSRILRFTPAGASDPSFGVNGNADAGFDIAGLEVQPDGRIVVGGVKDEQWAAARFTAAGAPDTSFGNGGVVLATPASGQLALKDIAIQPDGKIVLLANWKPDDPNERFSGVLLARFNRDGTPDSGFAVGGQTVPPNNGSGYTNHRTLTVDRDA